MKTTPVVRNMPAMMSRAVLALSSAASLVSVGGCESSASAPAPASTPAPQGGAQGGAAAEVKLAVIDGAGLAGALERHRGKVVLVDYWATWCAPCKKLFPHIVELSRKHAREGLVVISVSMDDPEKKDDALAFLKQQGAAFENFITAHGTGARSMDEFHLRGDVPLYRLYDRSGKLLHQFSGDPDGLELGLPLEQVDEKVKAALGQS